MRKILLFIFIALSHITLAQQVINLNDESVLPSTRSTVVFENPIYGRAEEARHFRFNPQLRSLRGNNVGDKLQLDFFDDRQYTATITNVTHYPNGAIGISAQIDESSFGFCYIAITNEGISINANLPDRNETFVAVRQGADTFLSRFQQSEVQRNVLQSEVQRPTDEMANTPPLRSATGNIQTSAALLQHDIEEHVTISILIPYTPRARQWATENETSIENAIILSMQRTNQASLNSGLGITFEVAHQYEVNYNEVGRNFLDILLHLTFDNDGYMDEVHALRKLYHADLVMMLPYINDVGGVAWQLGQEQGDSRWGFALTRIQQATWTTTLVHEVAHNMGAMHHRLQNDGQGLFSFSHGWRGEDAFFNRFSTIMTYPFFDGEGNFPPIDYFSDPNKIVNGVPIGAPNANNTLTLKRTKHAVSRYSDVINTSLTEISVSTGTLSPAFHPDITNYVLYIDDHISSVSINGTANYAYATVIGEVSNMTVISGELNTTTLIVTSHDNSVTKSYHIVVVKRSEADLHTWQIGSPNPTDVVATLTADRRLIVKGVGEMMSFPNRPPWYNHRDFVQTVEIEYGVTSIGVYAFLQFTSLTSVTIPGSVKTIENRAFGDLSSLVSIEIPEGVISIGTGAFINSFSLRSIILPKSLIEIGSNAFHNTSLHTITSNNPTPPTLIENPFQHLNTSNITLIVPIGSKATYASAPIWQGFNIIESISVEGVVLDKTEMTLRANHSEQLTVTVLPEDATNQNVTWSSSAPTVATVTGNGRVAALTAGTATITATTNDGRFTATCQVTVTPTVVPTGISLNKTATTLQIADTEQLIATILPEDADNKTVRWSSSVPTVATVAMDGTITALTAGTTTITATTQIGEFTATCEVTVTTAAWQVGDNVTATFDGSTLTIRGTGAMWGHRPWHSQRTNITTVVIERGVTHIGNAFLGFTALTAINVDTENTHYSSENGVLFNKDKTTLLVYPARKQETEYAIPLGVTRIEVRAFENNRILTSIVIPEGVTSVGVEAFRDCRSLTSITIPNSVTSIGSYAFRDCHSLTSITISENITNIGEGAFANCEALTSITIPNSVTKIEDYVFFGCSSLTSIVIPEGVTSIGYAAFGNCTSLTSITIPNSVTSIGDFAFENCHSLASVNISSSMTSIGYYTFADCHSLTSITIPESVTSIGGGAFWGCGFTSITIPSGVTSIGNHAFAYCRSLTSIIIPSSVTSIGQGAFSYCEALTSITIPESVTTIEDMTFYGCISLTSFTIPEGITSIGNSAFGDCWLLTSITIPSSVTSIGERAFNQCYSLISITIPEGITSIGERTFAFCRSLTSITIPSSVTSIGNEVFIDCSSLTSITFNSPVPPTIGNDVFLRVNLADATITVPFGSAAAYRAISGWSSFNIVEADAIPVTGVTLSETEATLHIDNTLQLTATLLPGNATNRNVTWSSSVPTVATVAEDGTVTALSIGTTTITVSTEDGSFTATCEITVNEVIISVESVSLDQTSMILTVGATQTLIATINPEDATNQNVTWSSSVPTVATVDNGAITAVSVGTTTITVTTEDGAFTATCTVTVTIAGTWSVGSGAQQVTATLSTDSVFTVSGVGAMQNYSLDNPAPWSLLRNSIKHVVVEDGVTNIGNYAFYGSAHLVSITFPASNGVDTDGIASIGQSAFENCMQLTTMVIPATVATIDHRAFANTALQTITIPESVTNIGASVFANNPLMEIVFKNPTPPTVAPGAFEGVNTETLTIVVPKGSKEAYKDAIDVANEANVVEDIVTISVESVSLNRISMTLVVDETETLIATINPEDATNKNVSWSSSVPTVATVAEDGTVTTLAAGTTIITVTTEDGEFTAACEITVSEITISVESVSLNRTSMTLVVDETETLIATINPEDATNKNVTWLSSDESVATVDADGKIVALVIGKTTITVTTKDGSFTATCEVTVDAFVDYSWLPIPKTVFIEREDHLEVRVVGVDADTFNRLEVIETVLRSTDVEMDLEVTTRSTVIPQTDGKWIVPFPTGVVEIKITNPNGVVITRLYRK